VILASSSPAAGSTVTGSVGSLKLTFNPPASLHELKITGPEGSMPMMIYPAGEVADYDLPLPDLKPGSYSVEWRASVGHADYSGTFAFELRK
jgi:methionine-rich copper-binding protein CopC